MSTFRLSVGSRGSPGLSGREIITRLKASALFRDYQNAFETATGLPLVLRAAGSFEAPLSGSKQQSPFCRLLIGSSKTCGACLRFQAVLESAVPRGAQTGQCFAGLSESMIPIHVGDLVIGHLHTGQILLQSPSKTGFRSVLTVLKRLRSSIDVAQLQAAYFETRVLTADRYDAVLRILSSFAQHLSLLSNELMLKSANAQPVGVARARDFIATNLGDELSLPKIAAVAHMSAFYFCKVFKLSTGLTLTEYLARSRVELTKQLLSKPQMRISEAAYAAGFQSLSQFNRVFRRVTGESPTAYRDHLHGAASAKRPPPFAA
jgi:AraC-like DNA-binding protein/ligand-binding sensor protein